MEPAKIFAMPTEKTSRAYRLSKVTIDRMARLEELLEKSQTAILEDAIAHLIGSLERDQPVYLTSPSDRRKAHKPPRDAA